MSLKDQPELRKANRLLKRLAEALKTDHDLIECGGRCGHCDLLNEVRIYFEKPAQKGEGK